MKKKVEKVIILKAERF